MKNSNRCARMILYAFSFIKRLTVGKPGTPTGLLMEIEDTFAEEQLKKITIAAARRMKLVVKKTYNSILNLLKCTSI
ncbi:MAG: hypothetical protein M3O71_04925 [Bacteroidota bacterium]|nr:hypothetical protein [Bacteroidota bacterium]